MEQEIATLFQHGLLTALIVAAPLLMIAWVVSAVFGLLQSVFQLPDPAVSFLPKLAVTALAFGYIAPWVVARLAGFTAEALGGVVR